MASSLSAPFTQPCGKIQQLQGHTGETQWPCNNIQQSYTYKKKDGKKLKAIVKQADHLWEIVKVQQLSSIHRWPYFVRCLFGVPMETAVLAVRLMQEYKEANISGCF